MQSASRLFRPSLAPFGFRNLPNLSRAQNASRSLPSSESLVTARPFTAQARLRSCRLSIFSSLAPSRFRAPRTARLLRLNSTANPPKPNQTPTLRSPESAPTLSARLKQLSREYGWTAVGLYLALSALDFPFCFLAVRGLGTDRIGRWEHAVMDSLLGVLGAIGVDLRRQKQPVEGEVRAADAPIREGYGDHGFAEAEAANSGADASIWTQLALAYAVHKSFIFIRVPLTAAMLPKVVKTLRAWGYNVGKRAPKAK